MKRVLTVLFVMAASISYPIVGASSSPPVHSPARAASPEFADPAKPFHTNHGGTNPNRPANGPSGLRTEGIAGGFVFVPINPYRAFDSRSYNDGYLLPGDVTYFDVLTNEFGAPQIPANAVAVTYNLTATDTTGGGGYLAIYPANINWPGHSSLNWTADRTTLANGGTVAIGFFDAAGQVEIYHGPGGRNGGTDFLLDITGYYI